MMGAISLKAGRESGRVYVENTDLEPVNSENITITEAEDTLNDSLSETRLLSSSESEEEEQEDPFPQKRTQAIKPVLAARKAAPKCGTCQKGFQMSRKLHIICDGCKKYFHKRHFNSTENPFLCHDCRPQPEPEHVVVVPTNLGMKISFF